MSVSIQEAEQLLDKYYTALQRDIPDNGIARYESWLPVSKESIVHVIKIVCALELSSGSMSDELRARYKGSIWSLPSFVADDRAKRINAARNISPEERFEKRNSIEARELDEFRAWTEEGARLKGELEEYISAVELIDPQNPQFFELIYDLAGAEPLPLKRERGQSGLTQLLGRYWNSSTSKDAVPLGRLYSIGGRTIFLGVLLWFAVECWFRMIDWLKALLPINDFIFTFLALALAVVVAPPIASYLFGFVFSIKHQLEADSE